MKHAVDIILGKHKTHGRPPAHTPTVDGVLASKTGVGNSDFNAGDMEYARAKREALV